jgi:putative transposase
VREADVTTVAVVARKHGISDQTIQLWRKRCRALEAVDVKHLRHLEQENGRLTKLVAEQDLEVKVMKEVAHKGPEFVPCAILTRLHVTDINMAPTDPGRPWQYGLSESFIGSFRDECLSM